MSYLQNEFQHKKLGYESENVSIRRNLVLKWPVPGFGWKPDQTRLASKIF